MLISTRDTAMSSSNSFSRLLSIRDKRRTQSKNHPDISNLFSVDEKQKRLSKEEERKVQEITVRLASYSVKDVPQQRIEYALRSKSAQGDAKEAFKLLMLYEDSVAGILRPFDPRIKLLGAENREKTTCYLDSLLFAMFAKPDVFEAILYNNFADEPRKRLVTVMRLWVNLLRTGRLVTSDIVTRLQESLAECGWADAAKIRQQDASEAFAFMTDKLNLPLLTLKTDIYHSGKEDVKDDHKFITERMLDVAIPDNVPAGETITLEMCLEEYFNNRVEVKRHLQRRETTGSLSSRKGSLEKLPVVHVETVEVDSRGGSPTPGDRSHNPTPPQRPLHMRARATSLFSERKVTIADGALDKSTSAEQRPAGRNRANSTRKEVLMPAWQFLNLIPWYADNAVPENDAQVQQHFSTKHPMLGICLKRYAVSAKGLSQRLSTHVDIPLEMACPHFDSGDSENERPPTGNFKLSLQSVVCHRGHSVDAGHYISLVRAGRRAAAFTNGTELSNSQVLDPSEDAWLLFDDLAFERVRRVDINKALKDESPYLLFYRVQPIDMDDSSSDAPPPYENSEESFEMVDEKLSHISALSNASALRSHESVDATGLPSRRGSGDVPSPDEGRGRSSVSSLRRSSIQWLPNGNGSARTPSVNGSTRGDAIASNGAEPSTPIEDSKSVVSTFASLSRASTRGTRTDASIKSLNGTDNLSLSSAVPPTERSGRGGFTISKITSRLSRDKLGSPEIVVEDTTALSPSLPVLSRLPPPLEEVSVPFGRASKEESPADVVRNKLPKDRSSGRKKLGGIHSRRSSGVKSGASEGKTPDRDCIVM